MSSESQSDDFWERISRMLTLWVFCWPVLIAVRLPRFVAAQTMTWRRRVFGHRIVFPTYWGACLILISLAARTAFSSISDNEIGWSLIRDLAVALYMLELAVGMALAAYVLVSWSGSLAKCPTALQDEVREATQLAAQEDQASLAGLHARRQARQALSRRAAS